MRKRQTAAMASSGVRRRLLGLFMGLTLTSTAIADQTVESCYQALPEAPQVRAERALYVFVDQTTPLTDAMKSKVIGLVSSWGKPGDMVKVARFSANFRGRYPELAFEEFVEPAPDEAFLYNLRYTDKSALLDCLQRQKDAFAKSFPNTLTGIMDGIDARIPKTDLLFSLRELAENVMLLGDAPEKTVLIVSDGLENSASASFYHNGAVRTIKPQREMAKVRKQRLVANWKGAEVYMYGIGLTADEKSYLHPKRVDALKGFWERYFVEGNAIVRALGTPELLVRAVD